MAISTRQFTSPYVAWGIRGLQIAFTIINLGLIADVLDKYFSGGSSGFAMFVDVLTLVYFIVFFGLSYFKPDAIIIGLILIFESFLALLWFIAFIVWAADFGGVNCNFTYYSYFNGTTYGVNSSSCHASKAVIAFGLLLFILFSISAVIFGIEVARPLILANPNTLWQTNGVNGHQLNKPFLGLLTTPSQVIDDVENSAPVTEEKLEEEPVDATTDTPVVVDEPTPEAEPVQTEPVEASGNPETR